MSDKMVSKIAAALVAVATPTTLAAQPATVDRLHEGAWYMVDDTDNNTGERTVYATRLFFEDGSPDFVTLTLRCYEGRPSFYVEWDKVAFPDQAVLTVGPAVDPDLEAEEKQFVLAKATGDSVYDRGLRASPETSAEIIRTLGTAKYAVFTAHAASGARTVGIEVNGTPGAWARVSRHCPASKMPLPPL